MMPGRVLLVGQRLLPQIQETTTIVFSPDLNPVEVVWKELKKYVANGRYWTT